MRTLRIAVVFLLLVALTLLCSCTLFGKPTEITTPPFETETTSVETTPEETTPEETTPEETTPGVTEPDFSNTPDPDGTKRY